MGKFDVPVISDGNVGGVTTQLFNQLSNPFVPYSTTLSSLFGDQLTGGTSYSDSDRILKYTESGGWEIAWLDKVPGDINYGEWLPAVGPPYHPTTMRIASDEAWYLEIRNGHPSTYLTLIGEVSRVDRQMHLSAGMNMVGTCFPVIVTMDQSNLYGSGMTGAPASYTSDRIWTYVASADTNTAWFNTAWMVDGISAGMNGKIYSGNLPTNMKFNPGKGYWIEVRQGHHSFTWNYPKPY